MLDNSQNSTVRHRHSSKPPTSSLSSGGQKSPRTPRRSVHIFKSRVSSSLATAEPDLTSWLPPPLAWIDRFNSCALYYLMTYNLYLQCLPLQQVQKYMSIKPFVRSDREPRSVLGAFTERPGSPHSPRASSEHLMNQSCKLQLLIF